MDGITEPVVLVLGHPIAGNPAQFALERAFDSLNLPWRVLSSDVPPDRIDEAIAGATVLGFRGLLLDRNLIDVTDDGSPRPDLYWRSVELETQWQTENLLSTWLESMIRGHFDSGDDSSAGEIGPLLWIGAADPCFPSQISSEQAHSPIGWASTEAIEHANLIALSETVDCSQWPPAGGEKLVIDFANPENDIEQIRTLGYKVLGREQARVGVLLECIQRLTGKRPMDDVLTEAIEEYLAV